MTTHDANKELMALAGKKDGLRGAREFFLREAGSGYNMLLWKCYLSHVASKNDGINSKERIALLGSSNIMPLQDKLKVMFHANGVGAEFYVGEYNNYIQELTSPDSGLNKFKPTITLMILTVPDILPKVYDEPFSFSPEEIDNMVSKIAGGISSAVKESVASRPEGAVYMALLPALEEPSGYVYSQGISYRSGTHFIKIFGELARLESDNFVLMDTVGLMRELKKSEIEDKRYWYLGRIRYTDRFFAKIAEEASAVYAMRTRPSKKCLVLDLDDTLWGGVIGQDGLENIVLGGDGLGAAYRDFQKELLKLREKGVILAICSKNNEADAREVFERHSGMILKSEHFAAKRINWEDKPANIKAIADELGIGLDSMVFFDDNPAEREFVRQIIPQVTVPDMPRDPYLFPDFVKGSKWFNSYKLSGEDLTRNVTYKAVAKSKELKAVSGSMEEYLKSLDQRVKMDKLDVSAISRAVQLCQKTNQFNMTTKRYDLNDLAAMQKEPGVKMYTVSVSDCFTDYGTVCFVILKENAKEKTAFIDTFILSCRVIGRRVEREVLDRIKKTYKEKNFRSLTGIYYKTEKNAPSAGVYGDNGFRLTQDDGKESVYEFELSDKKGR